jgi:hypothetical protein
MANLTRKLIVAHDHTYNNGESLPVTSLNSNGITEGKVPTSDGTGKVVWGEGGGGVTEESEGPGIDILNEKIGVGLDSILLARSNGNPAEEHPTIAVACNAAVTGDIVWIAKAGTFNESFTIRSGVSVNGLDRSRCEITGAVTLEGGTLMNVTVKDAVIGVSGWGDIIDCNLTGDDYAAQSRGGDLRVIGGKAVGGISRFHRGATPTPDAVYSLVGQTKGLSLWTGESNITPPTGWSEYSFDDSEWVIPNTVGVPPESTIDGADCLWVNPQGIENKQVLIRHRFVLDSAPMGDATLTFWFDDVLVGMYINGVEVQSSMGSSVIGWGYPGGPFSVTVSSSILREGENIIGYWGQEPQTSEWGTWKLEFAVATMIGNVYVHAVEGEPTTDEIPLPGDRSVWDAVRYPSDHTNDLGTGIHHRLGKEPDEAAAGTHTHNGINSQRFPLTNLLSDGATFGQIPSANGVGGIVWSDDAATEAHMHIYQEDHSDECDGVGTFFMTAQPFISKTTQVWLNGLLQRPGVLYDYVEDNMLRSILFSNPPYNGDALLLSYLLNTNPPIAGDVTGPYIDTYGLLLTRIKFNTHGHTSASDGNLAPATYATNLQTADHNALAITDHNMVTANPTGHTMIYVPSNEVTKTNFHIVSLNSIYTTAETDCQTIINGIVDSGGKAILAHPRYPVGFSQSSMASLTGYLGIEIFNMHVETGAGSNGVTNPGFAVGDWDYLLTNVRRNIWGFASDDYHTATAFKMQNIGRSIVFTNESTATDLMLNLTNGNFVADVNNDGVTPMKPNVTKEDVSVMATGATKIRFIGDNGVLLAEDLGAEGRYVFSGSEGYVRIEAVGDYTEPFDSLNSRWSAVDGTWTAGGGILTMALASNDTNRIILRRFREGDFTAQIDTMLDTADDDNSGFMFNVVDTSRYYVLRLGTEEYSANYSNRLALVKTTSGSMPASPMAFIPITPVGGTWYTIKMAYTAATGRIQVKIWVRGESEPVNWQMDYSDATWTHGMFGLRSSWGPVHYDNLYIDGFKSYYQPIPVGDWI